MVLTEDELKQRKDLQKTQIAFNCLGGKPTLPLFRQLCEGGTLVTYGGMTRQPIPTPIGPLIFKDVRLRGFMVTRVTGQPEFRPKRLAMYDLISSWMVDGKLKLTPHQDVPHKEWKAALSASTFKDGTPRDLPRKSILCLPEVK